ncbi:MAG: flagellin [Desulfurococcaceae archaeon]|jgi:archaellum component FlaG (FlaF/FlaG flagellin family)|nr:flagellin [Desulfurococcaceae archaeon]
MVSESISTAIIVIAGVILASIVSVTLLTQVNIVSSSMRIAIRNTEDRLRTQISITFVSVNTSTTKYFVLFVKNTGSRSISIQELTQSDIYLQDSSNVEMLIYSNNVELGKWSFTETTPDNVWSVGETITVMVYNKTSFSIPTKIVMVLPNGVSSEYIFTG